MKTVGCIAEFNPFHMGHEIYLKKAKQVTGAQASIVVMSGNFVQRGEPAIIDAARRAQCALACGADLVLELHPAYALSSAEFFASGAIDTLKATGLVTDVVFGSESGQISDFLTIADELASLETDLPHRIQSAMKKGLSYSAALADLLERHLAKAHPHFHFDPNNILGLEYTKAVRRLAPEIRLHTYRRIGAGYHEDTLTGSLESASAIRTHLRKNQPVNPTMVPNVSLRLINDFHEAHGHYASLNRYFTLLQYHVSLSSPTELSLFAGADEGLENLLLKKIRVVKTYEDLVDAMTSKRYPASRIRRYLLAILLSFTKETAQSFKAKGPGYLKPLGFNARGQGLLKEMKEAASLPVLSNIAKAANSQHGLPGLALDLRASDIYRLGLNTPTSLGSGIRMTPTKG